WGWGRRRELLQQLLHRTLQLRVPIIKPVHERVFYVNVRRYAGHLQVFSIKRIAAPCGYAVHGPIYQALGRSKDDPTVSLRANDGAQFEGFETGGGHLGIAERLLVDEENDGFACGSEVTLWSTFATAV